MRGTMPLPLSANCCTPDGALLLIERVPLRAPPTLGENFTCTVHVAADARVTGQSFVCEKSPLTVMAPTCRELVPALVMTTGMAEEASPTWTLPKITLAAEGGMR